MNQSRSATLEPFVRFSFLSYMPDMNWKSLAAALLLIMTWKPLLASDPFYDARLKAGRAALQAERPADAVDQLRIAAFGLMDTPSDLSQALALLAVAQNAAGRTTELENTMARFIEVETRFTSYDPASLDPKFRDEFESLLIRSVPKQTLASIPSLVRLVPGAQPRAARPAQAAAAAATPAKPPLTTPAASSASAPPASQTPAPLPKAPPSAGTPAPPQPAAKAASPQTAPATAGAGAPPAPPSREGSVTLSRATELLRALRSREALDMLRPAVAKEPARRDLRVALLEAAAMNSNWPLAAAQLPFVTPFADSESIAMFYAAVTLYETGKAADARALLNRCLPKLARSPYVDYYTWRITGKTR